MKLKNIADYIILTCMQGALCIFGFINFWKFPKGVVFCGYGDGLKNVFTLQSYLKEPLTADGLLKYNSFCYPYGEYVYYTDNTPLFSVPLRFFCHYIHDISASGNALFNAFIISNIIICSLLVYYVFRSLSLQRLLPFILAIVLPWANMEIIRITRGHLNLSFTSLSLGAICLLLLWHKNRGNTSKQIWIGVSMCVFTLVAFFIHGYFLAITTLFITAMLFIYGLYYRREAYGRFCMICSGAYALCTAGLVFSLLKITDKYLLLRKENAMGYDYINQKVCFSALFSHYGFNKVYFPVSSLAVTNDAEKAAYLGNIGLYALGIFIIGSVISSGFRSKFMETQKSFFASPVHAAILLGSLVLLSVSFGEEYVVRCQDVSYRMLNVFNPFFYLHFLTKRVEQFRSLERFVYPFFFGFYVWVAYTLVKLYEGAGRGVRVVMICAVVFLGGAELKDNVYRMHGGIDEENVLDEHNLGALNVPHFNYSRYQAILPIPYYCAGSEDYNYTLDADEPWSIYNYKLSLVSGLPSMAFTLSRVPPAHNISLINCVAFDNMSAELKGRFNTKPVLVALNKKLVAAAAGSPMAANPQTGRLYTAVCAFVARHQLVPIDSTADVMFYEWFPKG